MSQPFKCECGRLTRSPLLIKGILFCVVCAEDLDPDRVARWERKQERISRQEPNYWGPSKNYKRTYRGT